MSEQGLLSPVDAAQASSDGHLVEVKPKPRDLGRVAPSDVMTTPPVEQPLVGNPTTVSDAFRSAGGSPFDEGFGKTGMAQPFDEGPAPWAEAGGPLATAPPLPADKLRTISDLFEFYPELSDPNSGYKFEIERHFPKQFQNRTSSGNLGLHVPMTQEQFQAVIGGGKYTVRVKGPTKRGAPDPWSGQPGLTTFREIKVETPGDPVFSAPGLPPFVSQHVSPPMQGYYPQNGYPPAGAPGFGQGFAAGGQAEVRAVDRLGSMTETMLNQTLGGGGGRNDDALMRELIAQGRLSAEQALTMMRDQLTAATARADQLAQEARLASANNPADKFAERVYDAQESQRRMAQMTTDFAERAERASQAHREEMKLRAEDHDRRLRFEQEQAKSREETLRSEWSRERKMLEEMHDRALREVRADRSRDLDNMRADYVRQSDMMTSDHKRTVDGLRSDHERDTRMQESLHKIALDAKEAEMSRLRTDYATIKAEADALRREVHKPVIAQMREAKVMARMGGMVERDEVPDAPEKPSIIEGIVKALGPLMIGKGLPALMAAGASVAQATVARVAPPAQTVAQAPSPSPLDQATRGQAAQAQAQPGRSRRLPPVPTQVREVDGVPVVMPGTLPSPVTPEPQEITPQSVIEAENKAKQAAADAEAKKAAPAQAPSPAPAPAPAPATPEAQLAAWRNQVLQHFRPRGKQPWSDEEITPLLASIAKDAFDFQAADKAPEEFAQHLITNGGALLPPVLAWIDGEAASVLLYMTLGPQSGWDMAGPRKWIKDVWAVLEQSQAAG